MTRRELLWTLAAGSLLEAEPAALRALPGTGALDWQGDLSVRMMDGAHAFVDRQIAESVGKRPKYGPPDRGRFLHMIGAVDPRVPVAMERFQDPTRVRWSVLDGVFGEGLLLQPAGTPAGYVVVLGDADQLPEDNQVARALAANGFTVLVPALVDRSTRWSGHPDIKMTDQPHREWIYRQAYQMGRHIIGYEVQKVLAAVDWFRETAARQAKIGVAGYAKGGLIAFYAAAVDPRIDAALVSGYFDSRQRIWSEPIYRNVLGILREFGDAELATPDRAARAWSSSTRRCPRSRVREGDLKTPTFDTVYGGVRSHRHDCRSRVYLSLATAIGARTDPGSPAAVEAFARALGVQSLEACRGCDPPTGSSFDRGGTAETAGQRAGEPRPVV